jgi:hypothetical protein
VLEEQDGAFPRFFDSGLERLEVVQMSQHSCSGFLNRTDPLF